MHAAALEYANHENRWPSFRELRSWYWSQAYDSRAEAVEARTDLMVAFGAAPDEARVEAQAWAESHRYRERPGPTSGVHRGPGIIDAVKAAVPIEAVARELTDLREGRNALTGRCPFHNDRGPSFVVWPARGLWKCYGACAEGGDVVKLWQRAREKGLVR